MNIIPLAWDSDFFGLRIAKAELKSCNDIQLLLSNFKDLKEKLDLIYVFCTPGIMEPSNSMRLVDRKATFSLAPPFHASVCPAIREWESSDITDELLQLALTSGKYSRFRLDDKLPSGSYQRLYSHWIRQSVNRHNATNIFCYFENDLPVGMATLDLGAENGTIGLVAVNEQHQHRGIGRSLMKHVINYCGQTDCKTISVVTQLDNAAACRLYEKSGFQLESVVEVWHWWL